MVASPQIDERPFPLGGAWLSGALACCEEVEAASSFRLRASRGRDRHPVSELGASSQRSPVRPLVAHKHAAMRTFLLLLACVFCSAFHATPLRPAVRPATSSAAAGIQVCSRPNMEHYMHAATLMAPAASSGRAAQTGSAGQAPDRQQLHA